MNQKIKTEKACLQFQFYVCNLRMIMYTGIAPQTIVMIVLN